MQALCIASDVTDEDARQFVKELADNQRGISLSYMYHVDALKTGNSYTNEQHIKFKDVIDVSLACNNRVLFLTYPPLPSPPPTDYYARLVSPMKTNIDVNFSFTTENKYLLSSSGCLQI